MSNEGPGLQARVVVCARCGAQSDHLHSHVWRVDRGEHGQVFWFCARCVHRHHDAASVTGA